MTETTVRPRGGPDHSSAPALRRTPGDGGPPRPDDPRLRAWVLFLQAHAAVTRNLESELHAERRLSLADYDALVQLAISDDHQLRMGELAERVLLSRSGVSRLVDRLVADGLVARRSCPTDARGAWAALTPAGLDRLREAVPVHLRGVDEHFLDPIAPEDRAPFVRALEAIAEHLVTPEQPVQPDCPTIAKALES